MTTRVPCAHSGGPFFVFSLVASTFIQARHVASCEVTRPGTLRSGRFIRGSPYQVCLVVTARVPCACFGGPFSICSLVHVRFGPFFSRAPISVLLSCDRLGALCMFGQPVFCFLPCGIFVWSSASCRAMRGHPTGRVRVRLFRSRAPV